MDNLFTSKGETRINNIITQNHQQSISHFGSYLMNFFFGFSMPD